jgi:hypothetical protein
MLPAKKFAGKNGNKPNPVAAESPETDVTPGVYKPPKKKFFKKIIAATNKVNPATVLLRNGVLASMKLNIMGTAQRLRWSYMSEDAAARKGIDRTKHKKLISVRNKIEKIFYTAGGKPINLRKAILSGKGNKDKAVNGLGWVDGLNGFEGLDYVDSYTPLNQLLGDEIFYDENIAGINGLGQLGEPVTAASIAAATAVIAAIAKNLKDIGNLFNKKTKDADNTDTPIDIPDTPAIVVPVVNDEVVNTPTAEQKALVQKEINKPIEPDEVLPGQALVKTNPTFTAEHNSPVPEYRSHATVPEESSMQKTSETNTNVDVTTKDVVNKKDAGDDDPKETFWDKNKKWIKPVGIGVGALGLLYIGFKALSAGKNKASPPKGKTVNGLDGAGRKTKNHYRKHKHHKGHHHKVKPIALL